MPSRQPPEPSGTSGKPGERGATDRAAPPCARGRAKSAQKRPQSSQPPRAPGLQLDLHHLEEHFSSNLVGNPKKKWGRGHPLTSQPPSPNRWAPRSHSPTSSRAEKGLGNLSPCPKGSWGGPGRPFPCHKTLFCPFLSQQTRWRVVLLRPTGEEGELSTSPRSRR